MRARYPGRADNWPGCAVTDVVTSHKVSNGSGVRRSPVVTATGEDDSTSCTGTYAGDTTCWGWVDHGMFDTWVIKIGAFVHYHRVETGDTDQPTANVTCSVASTWGLSVDITDCGMLIQTATDRIYGVEFKSSSPGFGPIPATSVSWRTYVSCSRTKWSCTSPSVRTTV